MTPIQAVGVIFSSPKLLMWSVLPIAVTVVVLSLLFYALLAGVWKWALSSFTGYFASWSGAFGVVAEILAALAFLYVTVFTLSTLVSLFASPFNDLLAESTEKALGVLDVPPTTVGRLIRVFFLDLRKTVITLSLALMIALFMLVPVVGLLGLLGTAFLNTFTFVTYPQSRRETGVRDSIRWVRDHWAVSLGFGFTLLFLFAIPVVNLFAIPVAVVGGTLLWTEARDLSK
jgi:CysZ protein